MIYYVFYKISILIIVGIIIYISINKKHILREINNLIRKTRQQAGRGSSNELIRYKYPYTIHDDYSFQDVQCEGTYPEGHLYSGQIRGTCFDVNIPDSSSMFRVYLSDNIIDQEKIIKMKNMLTYLITEMTRWLSLEMKCLLNSCVQPNDGNCILERGSECNIHGQSTNNGLSIMYCDFQAFNNERVRSGYDLLFDSPYILRKGRYKNMNDCHDSGKINDWKTGNIFLCGGQEEGNNGEQCDLDPDTDNTDKCPQGCTYYCPEDHDADPQRECDYKWGVEPRSSASLRVGPGTYLPPYSYCFQSGKY